MSFSPAEKMDMALGGPAATPRVESMPYLKSVGEGSKKAFLDLCREPRKLNRVIQAILRSVQWSQEQRDKKPSPPSSEAVALLKTFA